MEKNKAAIWVYCLTTVPFLCIMSVVNVAHPLFHHIEGGTLDMVIEYLTATAAQLANGNSR